MRVFSNKRFIFNSITRNQRYTLVDLLSTALKLPSCHQLSTASTMFSKQNPFTILVEGNIASGKTQFLKFFKDIEGIQICEEPVNKWRNIAGGHNALSLLYQDARRWSMTLQSYVQLTMLEGHLSNENKPVKVMERSLYSARYVFVENLHQSGLMADVDYVILNEWFEWILANHYCKADLVIYLRAQPDTCLRRVHARGRKEELSLSLSYLRSIHECHENWLIRKSNKNWKVPPNIQVIDADCSLDKMSVTYREQCDKIARYMLSG